MIPELMQATFLHVCLPLRLIVLWVFFPLLCCYFNIPIHNGQHPGTNEWQGISKGGGLLLFIGKE